MDSNVFWLIVLLGLALCGGVVTVTISFVGLGERISRFFKRNELKDGERNQLDE